MVDLADGEIVEIQGSGKKPYKIRNLDGVYDCSCPAWRIQSASIDKRTCKHIKKVRGVAAEETRVGKDAVTRYASKKEKAKKDKPNLLLAHKWTADVDVTDWWVSEKLDGVRAYWDGERFISRLGNCYHAPPFFTADLPKEPLDGELWVGRGHFQKTVSIVRRQNGGDKWKDVCFLVFDAPSFDGTFEERYSHLLDTIHDADKYARVVGHWQCESMDRLKLDLAEVEGGGGEGLMLRKPGSDYEGGRSTTLLKVKSFHDAEATIIGHTKGKGKHKGRMGALEVKTADGVEFCVGTGFSDAERKEPPAVGATITFRYQELTKDGIPRFPSYIRVRSVV
ncbi:MAG: DNA ligase [Candidatus Thorarchaeota archaeon]